MLFILLIIKLFSEIAAFYYYIKEHRLYILKIRRPDVIREAQRLRWCYFRQLRSCSWFNGGYIYTYTYSNKPFEYLLLLYPTKSCVLLTRFRLVKVLFYSRLCFLARLLDSTYYLLLRLKCTSYLTLYTKCESSLYESA